MTQMPKRPEEEKGLPWLVELKGNPSPPKKRGAKKAGVRLGGGSFPELRTLVLEACGLPMGVGGLGLLRTPTGSALRVKKKRSAGRAGHVTELLDKADLGSLRETDWKDEDIVEHNPCLLQPKPAMGHVIFVTLRHIKVASLGIDSDAIPCHQSTWRQAAPVPMILTWVFVI